MAINQNQHLSCSSRVYLGQPATGKGLLSTLQVTFFDLINRPTHGVSCGKCRKCGTEGQKKNEVYSENEEPEKQPRQLGNLLFFAVC